MPRATMVSIGRPVQFSGLSDGKMISPRALPLRGDDLDTDRIMPARFLRAVTFEGLEKHVFEDDCASTPDHPFNNPAYRGASVLVVNSNFGCGSSREHAPQGLARYGFQAIVGESYSEIFQGNSSVLGIPCFTASPEDIRKLQTAIEQNPQVQVTASVEHQSVTAGDVTIKANLPQGVRDAFLTDKWNPTAMLLADFDKVRDVARHLPYVSGF
jgi:3-isopropylmalate/(R)-2-methylmalate dehydratase small subunit